jgi:hypothetical protein
VNKYIITTKDEQLYLTFYCNQNFWTTNKEDTYVFDKKQLALDAKKVLQTIYKDKKIEVKLWEAA